MTGARVVVFDLDDTLVVEEAGAKDALGEVVARLAGRPAGPDDVRDVLDALGAGMRAVWVSHGRPLPDHLSDVLVVGHLGELAALLELD